MNSMNAFYALSRTTLIFAILLILTRMLGTKQVSQMNLLWMIF